MRKILHTCLGLIFPFAAFAGILPDTSSSYSVSYSILIKGEVTGKETVVERVDAGGEIVSTSEHDMIVTDGTQTKRMTYSTRMVLSKNTGIPTSYSYWYTSGNTGDSYDVTIKNGQITRVLNRGGRTSESTIPLQPDMVFLDFNVYHQYDYLIRRYDVKKGGRQTFADFIPVIGNDVPVALTYLGDSKMELKTGALPVRNFRMEFVGIWGATLSIDKDGRLVRLQIPSQDLEVMRSDLLPDTQQ
jgi:hypothetical protein